MPTKLTDLLQRSAIRRNYRNASFPGVVEEMEFGPYELGFVDFEGARWCGPVIDLGEGAHTICPFTITVTQYDNGGVGGSVSLQILTAPSLTEGAIAGNPRDLNTILSSPDFGDQLPDVLESWTITARYIAFTVDWFVGSSEPDPIDIAVAFSATGVVS